MESGQKAHLFQGYYYAHNCGDSAYERNDAWLAFFDRIAERIIADFHPQVVLDAGCAKGFLVERLRARGVEAWGIDISEHAISSVIDDIKPYCSVASITDPLPRSYDLIVCIEVVEHMEAQEAIKAIENIAAYSDDILISSSPYDYKEATHFNVHSPDYWAREFARHNLFHDLDYDASYISAWAMRFSRLKGSVQPVIQAYERHLWQLQTEVKELRASVVQHHEQLQSLEETRNYISDLQQTQSWKLVHRLQRLRSWFIPKTGVLGRILKNLFHRKS